MAIHESDITVALPVDLDPVVAIQIGPLERKLLTGVVAHARLTTVIGHATMRLYSGARNTAAPTELVVNELESELHSWLQETPKFFHPHQDTATAAEEEDFYDVPWLLKRQQRTVRAAYFFASMLIYRGYLLREFVHQAPSTPRSSPSSERVKSCVDNAISMVVLAADFGAEECKYNAAFWVRILRDEYEGVGLNI